MEDDLRSPRKRPDIDYCTDLRPEDLLQRIENLENGQEKKDAEIEEINKNIEELVKCAASVRETQNKLVELLGSMITG